MLSYQNGFGKVHGSLFRPGPNVKLNACVGKNGRPAGFDRYAGGYFEAGKRLVKSLCEEPRYVDCVVYPLVMVYRHGAETALKHLAKLLPVICDETAEIKLTHKLMDNWRIVRRCMAKLDVDPKELLQIESKLEELVQVDPKGEVFRYPEAKDGTRHLQDIRLINVEVFGEEMDVLAQFFENACSWVDHLFGCKCEAFQREREVEEEVLDCLWDYHGCPEGTAW